MTPEQFDRICLEHGARPSTPAESALLRRCDELARQRNRAYTRALLRRITRDIVGAIAIAAIILAGILLLTR